MAGPKEINHKELDNRPNLPELIPSSDVTVNGEEFTYEEFTIDSGTTEKYEYVLSKGPINNIKRITGIDRSGGARTFSNGTDYELVDEVKSQIESFTYSSNQTDYELVSPPDSRTLDVIDESGDTFVQGTDYEIVNPDGVAADVIRWKDGGDTPDVQEAFSADYETTFADSVVQWQTDANNLPQPGTEFYVTYRAPSIVSRYLDTHEDKLNSVEEEIQRVIEGKFIESATGQELDEIGKLFGPLIGKRRDRTDDQYRIYLKSVVQSFTSRGTVNGIKLAISAATDVPLEDIVINEDFTNVEYEVQVQAATPVTVELLEQVAEIADPSGVDQVRTRFVIPDEETSVNDIIDITEGQQIFDDITVNDSTANFGFGKEGAVFENITVDDATAVNPNKINVGIDTVTANDVTAINPNTFAVSDENTTSDDTTATTVEGVAWDNENWDSFDWATENN
jgi:hypothetical protein